MPEPTEKTEMVESNTTAPEMDAGKTPEAIQAELEKVRTALREANREAAERRKKLEAYEAEEQKRKEAEMTETQKLAEQAKQAAERAAQAEQERDAVQARMVDTLKKTTILTAAAAAGFNDPADAWLYVDRDTVTVNADTGAVEGVDKAIKALVEKKPYLLKAARDTRPGSPPPPPARTNVQKPGQGGQSNSNPNRIRL